MNRVYRHVGAAAKGIGSGLKTAAIACVSIAACASEPTYNLEHSSTAQISQVDEICQKVMGLQPSDPLIDNLWPGNPDAALWTNDYRGCVASLSDPMENIAAVKSARFMEEAYRN